MFERLCAVLFRLYPLEFRRTYGRDAWQLIRDRAAIERSLYLRVRLLVDLLRDVLAITLRGWQAKPALGVAAAVRDGAPRFIFIEHRGLHPQWRLFGMLTSTLMFAAFLLGFQPKEFADGPAQLSYGAGADASADPGTDDPDDAPAAADISALRREIVEAVARNLTEHYYDPDDARLLGNAILTYAKNGAYDHLAVGPGLAHRLTTHIYDAGRTIGVPPGVAIADVIFIGDKLRRGPPGGFSSDCRVRRVQTMRRTIGYIKLDAFGLPHICQDIIAKALASVNDASALIIDLRDNGGGVGETALQIASPLFDRPVFMFDPRPRSRVPSHTTPVASSRLADKAVYLLTS